MDAVASFLREFRTNLRVADVLDIAVISLVVYFVLLWLRRRSSRSMALGVLSLLLLYVLARRLDMFLTSLLFQAGLTALLVALVLVFQDDIRRAFERLATWGMLHERRRLSPTPRTIDTVLEVVGQLAERRFGALIVLAGRESLERHVRGGIPVHGRISVPLLISIFHPASPGHDGAAIVEGDRLMQFGVHLPLSRNLSEVRGAGTRHAAALGMSEVSDALVIVVSEERGTISLAERGHLRIVSSIAAVKDRVERFHDELFPSGGQPVSARLTRDLHLKLGAVLLAGLLWLGFGYRTETVQRSFSVPVEYRDLPPDTRIEDEAPRTVQVMLSGPARVFDLFDPSTMVISLDLSSARPGSLDIPLREQQLHRPSGLAVDAIEPERLRIELQHRPD